MILSPAARRVHRLTVPGRGYFETHNRKWSGGEDPARSTAALSPSTHLRGNTLSIPALGWSETPTHHLFGGVA